MNDSEDTPFARWSRRKLRAREAPAAPAPEMAEEAAPESGPDLPEAESEAAALERLGLPDPDTLRMGDDFSVFMARAVPEVLRRRALRRLWLSNPVLANLDGLNDYDGDFTDSGLDGCVLRTAYRAGKGYLRQITQERGEGDAAPAASPGPAAEQGEAPAALPPETMQTPGVAASRPREPASEVQGDPEPAAPPRPRRMRFDFSGQV